MGLAKGLVQKTLVKDLTDEKFKFIDDLSVVEVINLISIGLACYNT